MTTIVGLPVNKWSELPIRGSFPPVIPVAVQGFLIKLLFGFEIILSHAEIGRIEQEWSSGSILLKINPEIITVGPPPISDHQISQLVVIRNKVFIRSHGCLGERV